jgi:ABC-type multidrug transport system permease subunit
MRAHMVMLVFRKDWCEIKRNWQILFPIVVVPFLISVLLPTLIIVTPSLSSISGPPMENSTAMMRNLPSQVRDELVGMNAWQALVYVMSLYFFAPFFLIIPLMASSVIASDSFAGEKERKTIEAILATPISDSELLLGKMLVSFIPSMIVTAASFAIYTTVIDVFSFEIFDGRLLLPNPVWLMLIFGVAPTIALAGIGLTVMISARVKGVREAQQISSILLLPILMLVLGQISGAIFLGPTVVAILIAAFVVVDLIVFYIGLRSFKREEILPRLS